jgi:hypothetical protein
MTRPSIGTVAVAAIITVLVGGPIRASNHDQRDGLAQFHQSLTQYMALRDVAVRHLPALKISEDMGKIRDAMDARAAAIRMFRGNAAPGAIFNPVVSELFRGRIRETLAQHGYATNQMISDGEDENGLPAVATVNGRFDWDTAVATPPCVLAVLPTLPRELEYRFVLADLALVDIEANLIVDFLADAIEAE